VPRAGPVRAGPGRFGAQTSKAALPCYRRGVPDRPDRRLRAADSDREAVAEQLREAAGDGRITLAELEERLGLAYAARTYADLEPLVADLPVSAAQTPPSGILRLFAPVNDVKRLGRWEVPPHVVATAGLGTIKLDLTSAVIRSREVVIEARANVGSVVVLVPEGFEVVIDDVKPGMGVVRNKVTAPVVSGAPRVRMIGYVGAGDVVVRHPRRSRWLPR
jgi:Domain of unknown function (DUF1707)